jgi:hypothetical protein
MRRAEQQQGRLQEREQQTRSWLAPLPDFSAPRYTEATKMRVEWDTRDTINNRAWNSVQVAGPKAVTAQMLAEHPTAGAEPYMPAISRQDERPYAPHDGAVAGGYFPDSRDGSRPRVPPTSLFQNAWLDGFDVEGGGAARELRSAVKEQAPREADISARIAGRTFQNQWIPPAVTQRIVNAQIDAADALRPRFDDWRTGPKNLTNEGE